MTRTDVAQADARLSGATADRVQAEGDVLAAPRPSIAGSSTRSPAASSVPQPLGALPANEPEAQQLAEVANPNIVAAQFDLAAARADVDVARSAL